MPTFTKAIDVCTYLFQDTLEDNEGELYICLALLKYVCGYSKKGRKPIHLGGLEKEKLITFNSLTPKGWDLQKTYVFLFFFFKLLKIKPEVVFYKKMFLQYCTVGKQILENPLFKQFFEENDTSAFFDDFSFFSLPEEVREFVEIKNTFDTPEIIQKIEDIINGHIDSFVKGDISKKYDLLSHEKQRNFMINKLSDFYGLVGNTFTIQETQFKKHGDISLLYSMTLLWKLGYIHILDFHSLDEDPEMDKNGKYLHEKENLNFHIFITSKAKKLFEGLFEMKNLILDKIFDEEYKQLKIIKKGGIFSMLEGEMEIIGDTVKFTELHKKYPHSEITAINYNGKTQKITVKEKIKLINP